MQRKGKNSVVDLGEFRGVEGVAILRGVIRWGLLFFSRGASSLGMPSLEVLSLGGGGSGSVGSDIMEPPVHRMTDRCKIITFLQLRMLAVIIG